MSPKGMHDSIVTAFNGKQDYTRSNKEVPPKDAQPLEGPNQGCWERGARAGVGVGSSIFKKLPGVECFESVFI